MILLEKAKKLFKEVFKDDEGIKGCYSHGRMEIIGNHTDHNNGFAIVAGCDMGITAAFRKGDKVEMASEGFKPFRFKADDLEYLKEQEGSSLAIVKGVMKKMKMLGYAIGGFQAALASDILSGAGVSSSAAFEALIVKIQMALYNEDKEMDPLTMANVCHYAESKYFGKPCGLLDQIGACYGGIQFLDFAYFSKPTVETLPFHLECDFVLVNTPSSHAKLTPFYAAIPQDMRTVAKVLFDKECLRECNRDEFMRLVSTPNNGTGLTAVAKLRAQHYFDENERVKNAREAILHNNLDDFLNNINASGMSSQTFLQNTMVPGQYTFSPQEAIDRARPLVFNKGAVRIHGGGFAGSILVVTKKCDTDAFMAEMAKYYGADRVRKVLIVDGGPQILD